MAETMNKSGDVWATAWTKPDGLYRVPNGRYFYVIGGVMHLPMHTVAEAVVLAKRKPLVLVPQKDGRHWVFMRAANVIAAWPHLERSIKGTASAFGFAL